MRQRFSLLHYSLPALSVEIS